MTNVDSIKTRSYDMSYIKEKNTKLEIMVRKFFLSMDSNLDCMIKKLSGKPDIVLAKQKFKL
jgi:DNA mismatch endonuclease, patch repair protein